MKDVTDLKNFLDGEVRVLQHGFSGIGDGVNYEQHD